MQEILICIGTGGELIKIAPVMRELQKRKRFQSLTEALKWGFFDLFLNLRKTIKKVNPKLVIVHGDTMTTGLTSLVLATLPKIKLVHVEAGIRSHDLLEPYPEEIMRKVTDLFSNILLAPTEYSTKNIRYKKKVYVTGNTNIDSLIFALNKISKKKSKEKYLIAKTHRQENIKSKERLTNFVKILTNTKENIHFILTSNTKKQLERFNLLNEIKNKRNIKILPTLSYLDFIKEFRDAAAILTDGGGETEESTYLKKPCLVYRHKTERQEAEIVGVARRVNSDYKKALKYLEEAFNKNSNYNKTIKNAKSPYGTGDTSKKIVDILLKEIRSMK